jgi:hypothetical protein
VKGAPEEVVIRSVFARFRGQNGFATSKLGAATSPYIPSSRPPLRSDKSSLEATGHLAGMSKHAASKSWRIAGRCQPARMNSGPGQKSWNCRRGPVHKPTLVYSFLFLKVHNPPKQVAHCDSTRRELKQTWESSVPTIVIRWCVCPAQTHSLTHPNQLPE